MFVDRWCHAPGTGVGAAYVSGRVAHGVRNAAAVTGGGAQYFLRNKGRQGISRAPAEGSTAEDASP